MLDFNNPCFTGNELQYIEDAVKNKKISGDGIYTKKCSEWMENKFQAKKVLLTNSCSAALDMAAILCELQPGDEVILPSFTFPSTANSFVLIGARLVFVDIRPDTMNIDENKIESAITAKTKAICVVHYAGVSSEMDTIIKIAKKHNLIVVEDAAHGFMSTYKGKALGTTGDLGCFSFHETKNFTMGEGGALVINNKDYIEKAEIIREKGTNRSQFMRGEVAKYYWMDLGDSYLPSDINAGYLYAQLEKAEEINTKRLNVWNTYYKALKPLERNTGSITLPTVPELCEHNASIFYFKTKSSTMAQEYIKYMRSFDIMCVSHFVPLHSSPAGIKYGTFSGKDEYTTKESEKLIRLPLYYGIKDEDIEKVINKTIEFFTNYE